MRSLLFCVKIAVLGISLGVLNIRYVAVLGGDKSE